MTPNQAVNALFKEEDRILKELILAELIRLNDYLGKTTSTKNYFDEVKARIADAKQRDKQFKKSAVDKYKRDVQAGQMIGEKIGKIIEAQDK